MSTSVYRKPTNTDCYFLFSSHHHPHILTRCMGDKSLQVCDEDHRQQELHHLEDLFTINGSPSKLVKSSLSIPQPPSSLKLRKQHPLRRTQGTLPPLCPPAEWKARVSVCTPWDQSRLQAIQHSETVPGPCEEELAWGEEEICGLPGRPQRVWPDIRKTKRNLKI